MPNPIITLQRYVPLPQYGSQSNYSQDCVNQSNDFFSMGCPTGHFERIAACSAALASCDFDGDVSSCAFYNRCCNSDSKIYS